MDFDHGFRSWISIMDFDHGFRSWISITDFDHGCRSSIINVEHRYRVSNTILVYGTV